MRRPDTVGAPYIKLSNQKKLLDNGAITKDEFEQQKTKILNP
jgi:hypothetical protein